MVADGVTPATNAHHAVTEFDGTFRPVLRHGESNSLSSRCSSHRVLVAFSILHSNAFACLLVSDESIEIMNASQLASGMIEA